MKFNLNGRKIVVHARRSRKKEIHAFREIQKYNFMKYWKVIRHWVLRNNDLTAADLDLLFYLHDEKLFNISKVNEYENILNWDSMRFSRLQKKGFIHIWRRGYQGEANLYELTHKGKTLLASVYKKLLGVEPIPTSERRNVLFKKNGKYSDKVVAMQVLKFNEEVKQLKQHRDTE